MSDIILKTENISKTYGSQRVLDNVSLTVNKGDIYGFIGENGAGKTTVIRVVTGLTKPDSGSYELFGVKNTDSNALNKAKAKLSAIVESPSIYSNFTALDNVLLNQSILGKRDVNKAQELLKLVGLEDVMTNKKAGNFSLGMRQRLGIAMCLANDPEFLILDEPLNGLDPAGIVEVRELILRLNQEKNITFMVSSHILTELNLIANRYGIISHGKMVNEVTKDEIDLAIKKHTRIKTSDNEKALLIIKEHLTNNEIKVLGEEIVIVGEYNVTELVTLLAGESISILNINTKEASIEDFYLHTLGGKENE